MRNNLGKIVLTIVGIAVLVLLAGFLVGTYMPNPAQSPEAVSISK